MASGSAADFERLARQYWGAWGDAMRGTVPGGGQPGMQAWQEALDWWTRYAHGGRSEVQVLHHLYVAPDDLASYQVEHFADRDVQIHRLPDDLALVQQGSQSLNDLCGTLVVVDDVVENVAQLLMIDFLQ